MVVELEYRIEQDSDPMNPRTECDNLGTMLCWHSRYTLGDEQYTTRETPEFFIANLGGFDEDYIWDDGREDFHQEAAEKRAYEEYIILSLYLYDHGGITMNTGGFSCGWDSGQVGWIIVSKEDVRKEYGWKNLTKKRVQLIEKYLRGEVETYDQYLTGDVWGYIIENEEHDIHDSCWGYFGKDHCENEAKEVLKSLQEQLNEKLKVVPRKLNNLEFYYSKEGDTILNSFLMEFWPNECRELDEILERGKVDENKILENETDRYYEVVTFLKEVMKGSISRYFNPRRTT